MSRKADKTWFDKKREWSLVKDATLAYYLKPYLQKVIRLNRPILLVDLFAGPGSFGDGSNGSPLILLDAADSVRKTGHPIKVVLAEKDPKWAQALAKRVQSYGSLADVHNVDCILLVDALATWARTNTTLLYVDPFGIGRLHLGELGRIYAALQSGSSVELLFIFMAGAFMRWAGACMAAEQNASHVLGDKMMWNPDGSLDEVMIRAAGEDAFIQPATFAIRSASELDAIAGGAYWREYAGTDSPDRLQEFVERYCMELRRWFSTVCNAPVYAEGIARVPKYWIVFGTRYRPAVDLINRAIKQARQNQAERQSARTLYAECELPPELPLSKCRELVVQSLREKRPLRWDVLRWTISEANLGKFTDAEINGQVKALIRDGVVLGADGRKVEESAVLRIVSPNAQCS